LRAEVEEAQTKLEAALRTYAVQQQEIDRLQKALVNIDGERATLAEQLATVKAAVPVAPAATSRDLELATAKLVAAEESLARGKAERAVLSERVALLEQAARTATPTVELPVPAGDGAEEPGVLRKELAEMQMKLETALRSFQLKQEENDRLQASLTALQEEKGGLESRIQVATTEASDLKTQSEAGQVAAAELERVREQLRNTQNQLESVVAENVQMRDRLSPAPSSGGTLLAAPRRPSPVPAAAAPAPSSEPQAATEVRYHVVVEGDTLSRIAKRYYGDTERWADIYEANRRVVRSPQALQLGTRLRIP
jgi:chromosome segregation ATPase/phage tail protein X